MHPLDPILLFTIANVVAWPVGLYVDNDELRRIVGHLITCTIGAFIGGLGTQWLYPNTFKISLIVGAFSGAILLMYFVRYRKWK